MAQPVAAVETGLQNRKPRQMKKAEAERGVEATRYQGGCQEAGHWKLKQEGRQNLEGMGRNQQLIVLDCNW